MLFTNTVRAVTGVVVAEKGAKLTGSLGIVFIAQFEWGVVVLLEKQGITATERLRSQRVHYQQIALMTGALCVELITVFIWRPEGHAWLTSLRGDAGWRAGLCCHQVLVNLTGATAVLCVTAVCCGPVEGQVLGTSAFRFLIVRVEPQLLRLRTRASAENLIAIFCRRPIDQLPARLAAWICILIGPGRGDYKTGG